MSRVDVMAVIDHHISFGERDGQFIEQELREVRTVFTELQAAAHAVLTASDLTDVLVAHDRLAAALAACGTVTATGEA